MALRLAGAGIGLYFTGPMRYTCVSGQKRWNRGPESCELEHRTCMSRFLLVICAVRRMHTLVIAKEGRGRTVFSPERRLQRLSGMSRGHPHQHPPVARLNLSGR